MTSWQQKHYNYSVKDYYQILGVSRTATADEIKQAYRRLAMKHHPDRGGDAGVFQELQQAYDILSDENKRRAYDNPQPRFSTGRAGPNAGPFDFDSIFEIFGADLRRPQRVSTPRIALWISLRDVMLGGPRPVSLQFNGTTETLEIEIPRGINEGDNIRYPGLAPGGLDLVVNYRILPDSKWQVNQLNLLRRQTVDIWDLILGCTVPIEDPAGNRYELTVAPETQPGTVLRIKNKGLPQRQLPGQPPIGRSGDLLIQLDARLPTPVDPDLLEAVRKHRGR